MDGWFVTGPAGPVGPYDVDAFKAGLAAGGITAATPVWREGRAEWTALASVPELAAALGLPPAEIAATANGASTAAAPAPAAAAPGSDPMAAFASEIAAIEAETAAAAAAEADDAADAAAPAGPATPDELEFEDDDGTWYAWDRALRKYVPKAEGGGSAAAAGTAAAAAAAAAVAAAAAAAAEAQYGLEAMTYAGGDEEVLPTLAAARAAAAAAAGGPGGAAADDDAAARKRKRDAIVEEHREKLAKREAARKEAAAAKQGWFELKNNTSVYVTGLPRDATEEEVAAAFSKCGLIKEGPDGAPRVKLYRNKETGALKGDALVTYFKAPSVQLATTLLDGVPLREGGATPMSVTEAKFEMKGGGYDAAKAGGGAGGGAAVASTSGNGGGGGSKGGGKGGRGGGRGGGKGGGGGGKGGAAAQLQRLERKLGWGGFDDRLPPERVTVVLSGLFDPRELAGSAAALAAELEADIAAEAGKLGPVERVRVFAGHPAGVATVKYRDAGSAAAALQRLGGRYFGGRRVTAAMWDGVTNYSSVKVRETAEEEAARLEAFSREFEAQAAAAAAAAGGASAGGGGDGGSGLDGGAGQASSAAVVDGGAAAAD